jgi:hypothetical protein
MAMSKTVLGPLMKSKIDALSDEDKADRDKVFEALADAVITHISTTAQIAGIIVTVVSVSGVTTGPGVSGPGAGTGIAPPGSIT